MPSTRWTLQSAGLYLFQIPGSIWACLSIWIQRIHLQLIFNLLVCQQFLQPLILFSENVIEVDFQILSRISWHSYFLLTKAILGAGTMNSLDFWLFPGACVKAPAHCHLIHLFHPIHLIRMFHLIHLYSTDSPDSPVSPDLPDSPTWFTCLLTGARM